MFYDQYGTVFITLLIGLPRLFFATILINVFSASVIKGTMLRNSVLLGLVLYLWPHLQQELPVVELNSVQWLSIVAKEMLVGLILGIVIGFPFLAVEAAGFIIDNQRGASIDSTVNPMNESETTPMGNLFATFFSAYVMVSGIIFVLLDIIYKSYLVWPIFSYLPSIPEFEPTLFLLMLDNIYELAFIVALPIIFTMFVSEFGLALLNRFSQQLNVFILSLPLKSGVCFTVLFICFPLLIEFIDNNVLLHSDLQSQLEMMLR